MHFTVGGLDPADDTAVITFTDINGKTVTDTVSANGETTVNLSSLADGTVTAALAATDTAGNSFSATSSNSATLDQDTNETPTLSFNDTLIGGPAGSGAESTAVHFTVGGLDPADDTAVITFTDINGKTVTDTVSANGETTVNLSSLADGTVTAALAATDTAGNSFSAASSNSATLDQDTNETPTLSFNDTLIGGPAGSGAESTAVHFTVGGLDPADDTAVITFTDINGKTVTDTVSANGETTVNLSSLADGTVTAALAATDTAGNSFSATSSNSATLDQDTNETPTLSFNDTLIGVRRAAGQGRPRCTSRSAGSTRRRHCGDHLHRHQWQDGHRTVSANGETTVNLSSNADGTVKAALAATDTAGNSFSAASSNSATLDQDTNETPTLSFNDTLIGGPAGSGAESTAVHFTVGGLDPSDDTAVITFTDINGKTVTDTVSANGETTVNLSSLADGTVTAALAATDTAGNSFSAASSNSATLDQDTNETPTLSFNDTLIGGPAGSGAESTAVHFTVGGLDPSDDTAVITFTDVNGKTVTDTVSANGETTVNLSSLADGTVTAALAATDTAGNSFSATSSNSATLDQDTNETATVAFADTNIGAAHAGAENFTVGGLDTDDNGTVTFSDGTPADNVVVNIVNGVAAASTVDLSGMADGAVTAALSVSDAAGNTFTANASATLDQDTRETATVAFADANIGAAQAGTEHFTVGGLDTDDNGTVTFSDGTPADNVVVNIVNGVAAASTVNLSGMADGTVTAALSVSDAAGNAFTANASANEVPTLTIVDHSLSVDQNGTVSLGISETPYTSGDPVLVTISGIPSDATLTNSENDTLTISSGSITLTSAQLAGLALHAGDTSGTLTLTAQENGPSTVNFDLLNTAGGSVGGAALASYLAGYGITMSVAGSGAGVAVYNQNQVYGGGVVGSTSGNNLIIENGGYPVSYTLTFATPLASFAFDNVSETAGSTYPIWSATAYDAAGDVLSTVGNPSISSGPFSATHYTLTGSNIASVTFAGNDEGFAGFANAVTDTWVLTPEATAETSAAQTISLTADAAQDLWTNSGGDSWSTAGNWSIEVPTSADEAVIAITGTVTISTSAAAESVTTSATTVLDLSKAAPCLLCL